MTNSIVYVRIPEDGRRESVGVNRYVLKIERGFQYGEGFQKIRKPDSGSGGVHGHFVVKYDMSHYDPTVIDINSDGLDWKYSTTGHFMCISGYDNTGSTTYAYVADPHYK